MPSSNEEGKSLSNQYLRICLYFVTPFEDGMVVDNLQASMVQQNEKLHIHDIEKKMMMINPVRKSIRLIPLINKS